MANLVTTKTFKLRTGGPQRNPNGFLMQTFGVERNITDNYCSITSLRGTENMQGFKALSEGDPFPNRSEGSSGGPFRSVSYQARRIILDDELVFSGTEDFVATYCDDEDDAISGDETSCINCVL